MRSRIPDVLEKTHWTHSEKRLRKFQNYFEAGRGQSDHVTRLTGDFWHKVGGDWSITKRMFCSYGSQQIDDPRTLHSGEFAKQEKGDRDAGPVVGRARATTKPLHQEIEKVKPIAFSH